MLVVVGLLTFPPGAPLRDPVTGAIIGTSPFMDSLIVIIALVFLGAGLGYGRGAGTLKSSNDVIAAIQKSWAGLAGLLFLFLLIAQFIAYFNYSNLAQIAAVRLGDTIETMNVGSVWLLLGAIRITVVVGIIMPQAIAKWALLAPIFVPLFLRLGVEPETVLAAYRVGDSPINIVTPIMAYFPLIVVFAARYDKRSGIGTIIALMLPYFIALTIAWTLFFVVWYLLGIPLGPGCVDLMGLELVRLGNEEDRAMTDAAIEQRSLKRSVLLSALLGASPCAWTALRLDRDRVRRPVLGGRRRDGAAGAVGRRLVTREENRTFQYGYWHIEPMSLAFYGGMLIVLCVYAFFDAVGTFISGGTEVELGWAIGYSLVMAAACFAMYFYEKRTNRAAKSAFIHLDAQGWLMSALATAATAAAFIFAWWLTSTPYAHLAPYVDPAILGILSLAMVGIPVRTVRKALDEILLITPSDLGHPGPRRHGRHRGAARIRPDTRATRQRSGAGSSSRYTSSSNPTVS